MSLPKHFIWGEEKLLGIWQINKRNFTYNLNTIHLLFLIKQHAVNVAFTFKYKLFYNITAYINIKPVHSCFSELADFLHKVVDLTPLQLHSATDNAKYHKLTKKENTRKYANKVYLYYHYYPCLFSIKTYMLHIWVFKLVLYATVM